LKNYLHSRESAYALGTGSRKNETKSNGHARAESHEFTPIVRMSNTLFQKGSSSESEVFDVRQGIYVIGMKGGSVDMFSGNFMFAAKEAYLIRNGSKEKMLRDVTVSGHILETLEKVERVGKDFGTSPGFCGKMAQSVPVSDGGPHVLVSEMKVG
ncbi:MAG: metallopeptidase TldD-related protein, partial [Candidatus ainarchaeum sp.]|nr:metallopeptidase TldD-related protein [Candidatus ainarchaeum sp.]